MANRFSTVVNKINTFPLWSRSFLLTKLFGSKVKFAGTAKVKLQKIEQYKAVLLLENKKKVQNHISGIHAVAAALLAESATGIVFGMNLPDDKLPLLKSMTINYQRRMQGNLTAVAQLDEQQIQALSQEEKGSLVIPVVITDESGQEPIECLMEWAWVIKNRPKNK